MRTNVCLPVSATALWTNSLCYIVTGLTLVSQKGTYPLVGGWIGGEMGKVAPYHPNQIQIRLQQNPSGKRGSIDHCSSEACSTLCRHSRLCNYARPSGKRSVRPSSLETSSSASLISVWFTGVSRWSVGDSYGESGSYLMPS